MKNSGISTTVRFCTQPPFSRQHCSSTKTCLKQFKWFLPWLSCCITTLHGTTYHLALKIKEKRASPRSVSHTCDTLRRYQRPLYALIVQWEFPRNGETVAAKCIKMSNPQKLGVDAMLKPWEVPSVNDPIQPYFIEIAAWKLEIVNKQLEWTPSRWGISVVSQTRDVDEWHECSSSTRCNIDVRFTPWCCLEPETSDIDYALDLEVTSRHLRTMSLHWKTAELNIAIHHKREGAV